MAQLELELLAQKYSLGDSENVSGLYHMTKKWRELQKSGSLTSHHD